ncbi:hypothetical protein [Kineococcus aurantiacus]|uniref:Uncharacterized protein n=1 Tax=Kineococcus aurantiacus TaxID=37633 RepID=A0A7Y9DQR8_9ACTN|nr:hypothetical protein [Kineococcus aurantiacus]NYD25023.1 hypothetical protein [Kineococcus aurantiacus]
MTLQTEREDIVRRLDDVGHAAAPANLTPGDLAGSDATLPLLVATWLRLSDDNDLIVHARALTGAPVCNRASDDA